MYGMESNFQLVRASRRPSVSSTVTGSVRYVPVQVQYNLSIRIHVNAFIFKHAPSRTIHWPTKEPHTQTLSVFSAKEGHLHPNLALYTTANV